MIRVSSSCSCSLLLSPCFPDHEDVDDDDDDDDDDHDHEDVNEDHEDVGDNDDEGEEEEKKMRFDANDDYDECLPSQKQ